MQILKCNIVCLVDSFVKFVTVAMVVLKGFAYKVQVALTSGNFFCMVQITNAPDGKTGINQGVSYLHRVETFLSRV